LLTPSSAKHISDDACLRVNPDFTGSGVVSDKQPPVSDYTAAEALSQRNAERACLNRFGEPACWSRRLLTLGSRPAIAPIGKQVAVHY
jgi:hypothetical protein